MHLEPSVQLRNGILMPRVGLGVWKLPAVQTTQVVADALKAGYRHIDTAQIYGNEAEVGQAIRASGLARKTLFITTKLWTDNHSPALAARSFEDSFKKLGVDWVDLFLSHFPVQGKRVDTWKSLQTLLATGRCRALGVSNYTVRHLRELIVQTGVVPLVNQVEFHPFLFQRELLEFCRHHGIQLVAYSPLVHGMRHDEPALVSVARAHGRSVPQVLLRWGLQHGLVVIPKTTTPARLRENLAVNDFQLSESDMAKLDALDCGFRTCWDPTLTP